MHDEQVARASRAERLFAATRAPINRRAIDGRARVARPEARTGLRTRGSNNRFIRKLGASYRVVFGPGKGCNRRVRSGLSRAFLVHGRRTWPEVRARCDTCPAMLSLVTFFGSACSVLGSLEQLQP